MYDEVPHEGVRSELVRPADGSREAVAVIRAEADRFAEVLAATAPDASCPTCPDWTAADLLWHLTEVHDFWARILGQGVRTDEGMQEVENSAPERPASTADMLPLLDAATTALLIQLTALSDDEPRWSWWESDQTVGFTRRMQVCEATMHRVDAELTAGRSISPIDEAVAALAIDHCADVMWGWKPDWAQYEATAVVELVARDTAQRWLVEVGHWFGTGPESGNEFDEPRAVRAKNGAKPTATVTGTLQDLALWAWTRGSDVDIHGEATAIDAINALIARGIQ